MSPQLIGDGQVQQLNVNDYYALGKAIKELEADIAKIEGEVELKAIVWSMIMARWQFHKILSEPCALLPSISARLPFCCRRYHRPYSSGHQ